MNNHPHKAIPVKCETCGRTYQAKYAKSPRRCQPCQKRLWKQAKAAREAATP